jgi:hypothetical protein
VSAFFVFVQPIVSEDQTAALMAHLFEMGFCDRPLNLRLLKKHPAGCDRTPSGQQQ